MRSARAGRFRRHAAPSLVSGLAEGRNGPDMAASHPVAIIMGSQSADWATMRHAAETLDALGIAHDDRIVSAHRTPDRLVAFAKGAGRRGSRSSSRRRRRRPPLPGIAAAMTPLPVFGVPSSRRRSRGQDSLLSIVQMPAGIGRDARYRPGRRGQRRAARRRGPRPARPGPRDAPRRVARPPERGGGERPVAEAPMTAALTTRSAATGRHDRHRRRRPARPDDRARGGGLRAQGTSTPPMPTARPSRSPAGARSRPTTTPRRSRPSPIRSTS